MDAPRILIAAGLDPSGRAGLLADVATVRALGAEPVAVATALTAQGRNTFALDPVAPRTLSAQVTSLLELGPVHAVKLGMIPNRSVLAALWELVSGLDVPVVVDPVVRTSRGQELSSLTPADYLRRAGPNVILTPNLGEAAWLLGAKTAARNADEAISAGRELLRRGFGGVIVKGGHFERGAKIDVVLAASGRVWLQEGRALQRLQSKRGTGCRYASAVAVGVARRTSLATAARRAKLVVEKFLRAPILGDV